MKHQLNSKLDEIAKCIFSRTEDNQDKSPLWIYNGEFGILLFMLYYSRFSMVKKYNQITTKYCETLLQKLGSGLGQHTFCSGLSGILYLFEFLKENEFIEIDISEVKAPFEKYLIERMRNDILRNNYDFMHGALGVGFYFLKSNTNKEIIQELIDFLLSTSEVDSESGGVKWKSKIEEDFIGYNIALSHGMASIVLFLCRVIESGFEDGKIKDLLRKTANYILSQEIDQKHYGSSFPNFSKESSAPLTGSRLAWCYGDLGVAYSIFKTGILLGNQYFEGKGLTILLESTRRKNNVYEAGICHGCMSMVLIYRRMFLKTNIQSFSDSVDYWLLESLRFSRFKDGPAGYKSYFDKNWIPDYSLLSGIPGIGLNYLSYLKDDSSSWDEMFLL